MKTLQFWTLFPIIILGIVLIPIGVIGLSVFQSLTESLSLVDLQVGAVLGRTVALAIGVLLGAVGLGVSLAWVTTMCQFPLRKFFSWLLLLPIAVPAYVLAFVWIGLLDASGPLFGVFPFRSLGGLTFVMVMALYPYVFLLARNAFMTQGSQILEVAQSLGYGPWQAFWKAALPMARPWIVSAGLLILMEVLADFGTVSVFNYDTFTMAIYKAWFGYFSMGMAARMSLILVVLALGVLILDKMSRRRRSFVNKGVYSLNRMALSAWKQIGVFLFCLSVFIFSFGIPFIRLMVWGVQALSQGGYPLIYVKNTLILGVLGCFIISLIALLIVVSQRYSSFVFVKWVTQFCTLGYALPGAVLAVGFYIFISWADTLLIGVFPEKYVYASSGFLKGTILVLLLAYLVRFLALGYQSINSSIERITLSVDESARSLGASEKRLLKEIHIPLLKGGLLTALLLVFVEVIKEICP